jgi:hypothetical protein
MCGIIFETCTERGGSNGEENLHTVFLPITVIKGGLKMKKLRKE